MRLNGLTYECVRPSVQSYINKTFVTQRLNRMRQNEKNRHETRPCKRALRESIQLFIRIEGLCKPILLLFQLHEVFMIYRGGESIGIERLCFM